MSRLRDHYANTLAYDVTTLESAPWYLTQLALRGAIEIDNHLLGRNDDFSHVKEFADILSRYQLKDTDDFSTAPHFPYVEVWRAIRKDGTKDIRRFPELALEMRLLGEELSAVPHSTRMPELRSTLCNLSSALQLRAISTSR